MEKIRIGLIVSLLAIFVVLGVGLMSGSGLAFTGQASSVSGFRADKLLRFDIFLELLFLVALIVGIFYLETRLVADKKAD